MHILHTVQEQLMEGIDSLEAEIEDVVVRLSPDPSAILD